MSCSRRLWQCLRTDRLHRHVFQPTAIGRSGVTPVTILADSKNAFAAAISRCSLNIASTGAPARSMAR
jgi:hypothetical protein